MITVGLDLSLVKTGYAILKGKDVTISGVIKSKPTGDKPIDELERISLIVEEIVEAIDSGIPGAKPDLVMIEGLAFMARNTTALVQLAGLNYFVRLALAELSWPFVIVAPTTLKKFVTGSGKGDKDKMMMCIYKDYGFEAFDNNVNDAYSLGVCGQALLGEPLKPLTKPQQEVIKLLKKQL